MLGCKPLSSLTRPLAVAVSTVVPGTQSISEYDLIDLSCLMEWTHAQLTNLAKRLLEELKIDQEIDFKIVRGERQSLLRDQQAPAIKRLFSRGH